MQSIVMVCLGNICRSPIAEAVLTDRIRSAGAAITVSSAGTGAWHVGHDADPRSLSVLRAAGYSVSHAARQFQEGWFDNHDLIIAMDHANQSELLAMRPGSTVHLLREWDPLGPGDVPDPYYGGPEEFAHVLAIVERSCDGLMDWLRSSGYLAAAVETSMQ